MGVINMADIQKDELQKLIDDAKLITQPHVDFYVDGKKVRVGVADLQNILHQAPPTLNVNIDNVELSFSNENSGFMARLKFDW